MTHIAMFDAINAIEREFEPYHVRFRHGSGGSPEAAAAQAAHDVLVGHQSRARATYDAALASRLGDRPRASSGAGRPSAPTVAREILAWRAERRMGRLRRSRPTPSRRCPGRWQPTPPANAAAAFTHLQHAAPMALLTPTQYPAAAAADARERRATPPI